MYGNFKYFKTFVIFHNSSRKLFPISRNIHISKSLNPIPNTIHRILSTLCISSQNFLDIFSISSLVKLRVLYETISPRFVPATKSRFRVWHRVRNTSGSSYAYLFSYYRASSSGIKYGKLNSISLDVYLCPVYNKHFCLHNVVCNSFIIS